MLPARAALSSRGYCVRPIRNGFGNRRVVQWIEKTERTNGSRVAEVRRLFSTKSKSAKAEAEAATEAAEEATSSMPWQEMGQGLAAGAAVASGWMLIRPENLSLPDPYNGLPTFLGLFTFASMAPTAPNAAIAGVTLVLLGVENVISRVEAVMRATGKLKLTGEEAFLLDKEISSIITDKRIFDAWKANTADPMLLNTLATSIWLRLMGIEKNADSSKQNDALSSFIPFEQLEDTITTLVAENDMIDDNQKDSAREALLNVFSVADIDNNGIITFPEFYRALTLLLLAENDEAAKHELFYHAIDLDNNGFIDRKELLHFIKRLHAVGGIPKQDRLTMNIAGFARPATPEEICFKWMKRFDIDGDGIISRDEFFKMAVQVDFSPAMVRDYLMKKSDH